MRRSLAWEERKCVATGFPGRDLVWAQGLGPLSRQSFSYRDREADRDRVSLSRRKVLGHDSVLAKSRGLLSRQGNAISRQGWPAEGRVDECLKHSEYTRVCLGLLALFYV